jgi:glycerol kinase
MRVLVGIDEGTSAVKASIFDLDLNQLATVRREKRTSNRGEGLVEQDPFEVLELVIDAVAELLDAVPDADIVACGLDHQGESVVAWDRETGAALSPIVTWQDKRSQSLLDRFSAATLATITDRSGLPVDPYFSAGKVAWLLEQGLPDDVCIGTVDSYLCAQLGAGFATDRSTASRTQLVRLGEGAWDQELCTIFGVRAASLPSIRDSIGALGTLSHARWRSELPLRAQVADQQAALAGSGCVVPGRAKATFGTGVFVLAFTGAAAPAGAACAGIVPTVAWAVDGVPHYALDGGVFSAGSLLDWLAVGLGLYESPQQLAELAASVETAQGVRLLPALSGLGAPWWNPDARAVISGLSGATEPAHIARAAIEGICHRVCDVLDAMSAFVRLDELRIDGGLTQSDLVPQLLADLAQMTVELGAVDATSLGAAALAAVGAGVLGSVEEIADKLPPEREFRPRPRADQRRAWREFVVRAGDL